MFSFLLAETEDPQYHPHDDHHDGEDRKEAEQVVPPHQVSKEHEPGGDYHPCQCSQHSCRAFFESYHNQQSFLFFFRESNIVHFSECRTPHTDKKSWSEQLG